MAYAYEKEIKLSQDAPTVPKGYPFRKHIQEWYDDRFRYSDTIFITIQGCAWAVSSEGVQDVIVVYHYEDLDDGDEDDDEFEFLIEPRHIRPLQ